MEKHHRTMSPMAKAVPHSTVCMRLRCTLKESMKTRGRMEHFWLPQWSRQTYWRSWLKRYICIQICDVAEGFVKKYPAWRNLAPSQATMAGNKASHTRWKIIAPNSEATVFLGWCAIKRKSPGDQKSAKNVKKPWKAEVNYLPPYQAGENEESQEQERIQLLTEVRERDKNKFIQKKKRWPKLLHTEEMKLLTNHPP